MFTSTKKWCLKEDTNNIYDKIGNICNNTRDKIYSGTSVFKAPKGTRTMYQISI
jgi:hypothetical protein